MKVVIIDYGAGNTKSIQFALQRLGCIATLSSNPEEIIKADKVIFPGVGEASSAMRKLVDTGLHTLIPTLKQPVLGICLGMQLLCDSTQENDTEGLGVFNTQVVKFNNPNLKVPQMGWNTITNLNGGLFNDISDEEYMYFVHSYYALSCDDMIASTVYDIPYACALQKNNFYGVQFHPEKSSRAGSQLLKNFLEL